MALYCSDIGFDIQNFPIVPNRLDIAESKLYIQGKSKPMLFIIKRKSGLVA